MFLQDSTKLSFEIAKMSIALANAAYDQSHIHTFLKRMGFSESNIQHYNYDRVASIDDNDFVAYTIATN